MTLDEHIVDIQRKLRNEQYPNEQSISQGIVLRLLSAMEWPVYDPQLVIPEYSVEGRRVDFALCAHKNKPVIFIEVKQPGNTFGADKQLFEYAFHRGVPFAIVTDGKEWHFYLPAEIGSYDERRVYKLDLLERNPQESSYRLERYLSFSDVRNGKTLENARQDYRNVSKQRQAKANIPEAWRKLIDERDELLIDIISEKVESMCGFMPTPDQVLAYLASLNPSFQSTTSEPKKEQVHQLYKPSTSFAKRSARSKIKVTFPDGIEICKPKVADTMVAVIRKIGCEKVRSLNLQMYGCPIISNQRHKQDKYNWSDADPGIYVLTHSNTKTKISQLNEINNRLGLKLKIEEI